VALTMTRTRTQTALTMLAGRVAKVHGELTYVDERLAGELPAELREGLTRRRGELLGLRIALYATLRQFDSRLDPTAIGATEDWLRPYGRGNAGKRRYEAATLDEASSTASSQLRANPQVSARS
jgi:hypothetical protein